MPKKVLHESIVHQLTRAAERVVSGLPVQEQEQCRSLIRSLSFEDRGKKRVLVRWGSGEDQYLELDCSAATLYTRGDDGRGEAGETGCDAIEQENQNLFVTLVETLLSRIATHSAAVN